MGKKGKTKNDGIQIDIYGNPVHILNTKEIFRVVKCEKCGETVKSSKAKLHLSYGKNISICEKCLEEEDNDRQYTYISSARNRGISKMVNTIESYVIGPIKA